MAKVERILVARGQCFDVECAVRADLSSPVGTFIDELTAGSWHPDYASEEIPADEQIDFLYWFTSACNQIATNGQPPHNQSFNQLQNGIWEIKHWDVRVSFYDTDGSGEYQPLIDYDSYRGLYASRPWPDDFDEYLRLTTAFTKSVQKAHIELAQEVREEDLQHDQDT